MIDNFITAAGWPNFFLLIGTRDVIILHWEGGSVCSRERETERGGG